jgi:ABC-type phosphate/phosphonate transport system permease subunit
VSARFAIDRYIFRPAIPPAARRSYLLSRVTCAIGLACLTILAFGNGPRAGAVALAAVSRLALGQAVADWRKYRRLYQPNISPPATAP